MVTGPPLRDIHLPPEPGWWPPAPGWWVLAALALLLLVLLGRGLLQRWRKHRWRARLDALLARIAQAHATEAQGAALAAALSEVLRRGARAHDPAAAALHGEAWLCWLDADDPEAPFSRGPGRLLADAPFRAAVPRSEVAPLLPMVRARLRRMEADHG